MFTPGLRGTRASLSALLVLVACASSAPHDKDGTGGTAGSSGAGGGAAAAGSGSMTEAGESGVSGSAAGGESGTTACGVDIVLSERILSDAGEWSRLFILPESVWATERGIHVLWYADQFRPDLANTPPYDGGRSWLHLSTFDPNTGSLSAARRFDVFPPETTSSKGAFTAAAGAPDGTFIAIYSYGPQIGPPDRYRYWAFMGHLDDNSVQQRILLSDTSEPSLAIVHAGWDGEAFAIHATDAAGALVVARLDVAGQLITDFTPFGADAGPGWGILGYKVNTDPESGRTFLFDAPARRGLAAHERDGTVVPWIPPSRWLNVSTPIVEEAGAAAPMLRADGEGGAWLAWLQGYSAPDQRRGQGAYAHYDGDGTLDAYGTFLSGTDMQYEPRIYAFFPEGGTTARLFAATPDIRIYQWAVDGASLGEPEVVVDAPCDAECTNMAWMGTLNLDGDAWLWFQEPHPDVVQLLRIVKVVPGCTYGGVRP